MFDRISNVVALLLMAFKAEGSVLGSIAESSYGFDLGIETLENGLEAGKQLCRCAPKWGVLDYSWC
ncbi:hypothetical protein ENSA5_38530 [Enhygromyxa salina]|uniref:Uncharacterized protein n=1 Tax=Enhygromyxa salina TaxID=215803 RepID=A0A2S9XRY2_9BACT|nr:hypothetical protein ENSA5_38530 [Enhygromyxa salina]